MPRNNKAKPLGQSRQKTAADELYNARRRAKRAAARLEREMAKAQPTRRERAATQNYIESLRAQIEKTYTTRGADKVAAQRAAKVLDVQTMGKGTKTAEQRKNLIFERQLNLAGAGRPSTLAKTPEAGQAAVKIFYKATQSIWEGLPPEERNRAIMAKLGASTLQEAYMMVLRANAEAFREAVSAQRDLFDTEEEDFMEEPGEGEQGSPSYLARVSSTSAEVQAARGE